MKKYLNDYINEQRNVLGDIPVEKVRELIQIFHQGWKENRQIFVFGNGGSAANASHFVTDLGKSASDKMGKPFRCISLNDNVPWITAIANDYSYEDVFKRQLQNYGKAGDIAMTLSVSGNSPNIIRAMEWANENDLFTIALTGNKKGKVSDIVNFCIAINSSHYGKVEDAQMGICHMICYAFIELSFS